LAAIKELIALEYCDKPMEIRKLQLSQKTWFIKVVLTGYLQCFFANFKVCHLVELSTAFLKKCDQGMDDNPFIILNNSIKSALFLLSSRDYNPN